MPSTQKTFRVFVSSTFSDFREERRILQKDIFPRLKTFCESKGAGFQAIDLRWGVDEKQQLDQRTMDICLNEIHRCQKLSPKPNFIILIGDRYGWQPVPDKIPSSEMDQIRRVLEKDDLALVERWYGEEDKNADPPEYLLQPRGEDYSDYDKWQVVEEKLREILRMAVKGLHFTEEQKVKYFTSATHQEIIRGALNPPEGVVDPKEHVFAYMRSIKNLPETLEAKDFIDLKGNVRDGFAKEQLTLLRDKLRGSETKEGKLPDKHVYTYEASWNGGCVNENLNAFAEQVYSNLQSVIEAQIAEMPTDTAEVKEIKLHQEFKEKRLEHFTGRKDALDAITEYLQGRSQKVFSIIGALGSGKTSIIAKAIEDLKGGVPLYQEGAGVCIFRFIGTTSNTSDAFKLLSQIINQISKEYGVEMNSLLKEGEDEKKFGTLYGLRELFARCLNLASKEKPLVIFLDALDQLSADLSTLSLDWLPKELPDNVRMVVSALPELKDKLSHTEIFELKEMSESDGKELLDRWLGSAKRILQKHQRDEVINKFTANGTPLYLRLAFEKARDWRSYSTNTVLKPDIEGMLGEYFDDLQKDHGKLLVGKFCGYVLSGKYQGLTENELLDLFVFDKEYWNDFLKGCHPDHREEVKEIGKLPVVVWSRLFLDIEPYLTEKDADGIPIISFYHRKFIEFVRRRYLDNAPAFGTPSYDKRGKGKLIPLYQEGSGVCSSFHHTLADYFEKEPLYLDDKEKTPNIRKVVEQPYQQTMAGQWKEVIDKTLANFPSLMSKAKANMIEGILNDYRFTFASAPQETKEKLKYWEAFFRERMHILRRGSDGPHTRYCFSLQ